jgi:Protein of unknown function (DUF3168)
MANDSSLDVRIALVTALKAAPALALPLPSGSILGGRVHVSVPAEIVWPYLRVEVGEVLPYRATGIDGAMVYPVVHAFAEGATDDDCSRLSARVAKVLDGRWFPLEGDYPAKLADVRWTGTQVLRDIGASDGWHGVIRFVGTVVS